MAHRFLAAFLRYEIGDLSAAVRGRLRRSAEPRFLAQLLSRPPDGPSATPSLARVAKLRIILLSSSPGRALVNGSARRDGRIEQFSFLFETQHGAWRAVGPGE